MYKNKRNVGAHDCAQKGITLIALVITIIVMLILVAVTISMAVNGGLFEYAGKAVGDTQNEIDAEQQLANGKIKVGNTWYDSIDDYLNNIPSGTQNIELDEGNGTGEETTDDDENGEKETGPSVGDYISNYPVEYENVASYSWSGSASYYPQDKFENKWRVLSKETDEEGNEYVRLVSAGIPLSYYHPSESGAAATSVANLTTGFLTTEINSSTATSYKFYKCGFDIGTSTNLSNVFTNDYTQTGKVQSLTKDDVDGVVGSITDGSSSVNDEEYGELLALPCEDTPSYYAYTWLASEYGSDSLWIVYFSGYVYHFYYHALGVRPVVSLKSSVKFSEADTKINETTTWEISL